MFYNQKSHQTDYQFDVIPVRLTGVGVAPPKTLKTSRRLIDSSSQQVNEALNGAKRRKKGERTLPRKL